MRIILFAHPCFMASNSMPRFSAMIAEYLSSKGIPHNVWMPKAYCRKLTTNSTLAKWLGYIDQYVIFPLQVRWRVRKQPSDTLYVFCDQALGPWVPLVKDKPHVIHCHDFMALKSALGIYPENPTSTTGRLYQQFIRSGVNQGKNFIAVSEQTKADLLQYTSVNPHRLGIVYNGLNYPFKQQATREALAHIIDAGILKYDSRCLLHVGAGQWYKNTIGVIKIYGEYCKSVAQPLPLVLVSPAPKGYLLDSVERLPSNGKVTFVQSIDINVLEALYSYASAFIFPSLVEGFGWPLIEAQACGCPVIANDLPPMNEVGGENTYYISRNHAMNSDGWVAEGAAHITTLLALSEEDKAALTKKIISWANNFDASVALDGYLDIYTQVFESNAPPRPSIC